MVLDTSQSPYADPSRHLPRREVRGACAISRPEMDMESNNTARVNRKQAVRANSPTQPINRYYVYLFLRAVADKYGAAGTPIYVGKGSGYRAYSESNRPVRRPKDRSLIVIVKAYMTEEEAYALEIELIRLYGRIDIGTGCLANLKEGGNHASPSPSTRRKLSEATRAHGIPDEQRARMLSGSLAAGQTLRYRENMSRVLKGRRLSEETKQKISSAQRGRSMSEDHFRHMVDAKRAKNPNPSPRALYLRRLRERHRNHLI